MVVKNALDITGVSSNSVTRFSMMTDYKSDGLKIDGEYDRIVSEYQNISQNI